MFYCVFLVCLILASSVCALNSTNERKIDLDCGGLFTTDQFVIESPNYPSNYPSNLDCYYLLQGPDCPFQYTFQFLDFSLEKSLGCTKDRLSIDDQDALCNPIKGAKSYFPKNGVLQVRFITDAQGSGRGFRILVTRSSCENPITTSPTVAITPKLHSIPAPLNPPNVNLPFCCSSNYREKRFFLISPGFPYSNGHTSDCLYHVYRANNNICRLRIHFLFFWSGIYDHTGNCNHGFLQIDGRTICGCRVGLKLTSPFDERWANNPKVIRFKNFGLPKTVFSGFALEIIQDECPKKFIPENKSINQTFHYYNDQINRVAWPNDNMNTLKRALQIDNSTELLDDSNSFSGEEVIKHYYFFEAPDDEDYNSETVIHLKEPEETTYVDTYNTPIFPNGHDNYACRAWGVLQWTLLAKQMLFHNTPSCQLTTNVQKQCVELNYLRGYFQSPGYPFYYPGNLNVCYRFIKPQGYCYINFHIIDFQMQESFECTDSHLLLGGKLRYCGTTLYNKKFTIDITNKAYEEIVLKTNMAYCARGFKGFYELVECRQNPHPQPTTPAPSDCSRNVDSEVFTIDLNSPNHGLCIFNIIGVTGVCVLELVFARFNLICGLESLKIRDQEFCGELNGQVVTLSLESQETISLEIKKTYNNPLEIQGRQINCDDIEVPAQRQIIPANVRVDNNNGVKVESGRENLERQLDGICGIIMNVTDSANKDEICEKLKARREKLDCFAINPQTIYVPSHQGNEDIKLPSADVVEVLSYKEISCDDLKKTNLTLNL